MTAGEEAASIHASAVLVGAKAVLIRGPSGIGKSRLAWALLEAARTGGLAFARLVADDRVELEACHGRLLVRPAAVLAGLLEVRGLGICRFPYEPVAVAETVVDLNAADAERLPTGRGLTARLHGITLRRLALPPGHDPWPMVFAELATAVPRRGP
jgi:serine kinase of HPr protein (carbohydrate metabolism regulator)